MSLFNQDLLLALLSLMSTVLKLETSKFVMPLSGADNHIDLVITLFF